jgi:hypothetical protein
MNDLIPKLPKGVHTTLYADDLVLWCTEEYATTATYRMPIVLDKVVTWAEQPSTLSIYQHSGSSIVQI